MEQKSKEEKHYFVSLNAKTGALIGAGAGLISTVLTIYMAQKQPELKGITEPLECTPKSEHIDNE